MGTISDETMITVKSDPRLVISVRAINEVYETSKKIETLTQTAADAVKQLVESKNVVDRYIKEFKELDKEKYKPQIKVSGENREAAGFNRCPLLRESGQKTGNYA